MKQDAIMGALYTGFLSLAVCDADLAPAADSTQVAETAVAVLKHCLSKTLADSEVKCKSEQGGPEELKSILRMSRAMAPDGSGSDSEKVDLLGSVTSEESGSDKDGR